MEQEISQLIKHYSIDEQNFEDYKKRALLTLTTGKKKNRQKTLIIVGGQPGAGKSRLVPIANRELQNNAIIVDFDELRSLHPHYQEVSRKYPEITHRILHPDTERVKNEVLKSLIENGYDVVYEGTLRSTQGFVDFAKDFRENGYTVKMYIMAVSKLESYGSTFLRYALAFESNAIPRWVEQVAHDEAYEGVLRTVERFTEQRMTEEIHVFVRSDDEPRRIYTTPEKQYSSAREAIQQGRNQGRKKAVQDYDEKYKMVRGILDKHKPEMIEKLGAWEELCRTERAMLKPESR